VYIYIIVLVEWFVLTEIKIVIIIIICSSCWTG